MATTKADKTETKKAVKQSEVEDRGEEIVSDEYPYEAPPSAIPTGASKPPGEKVEQVSGGGEPSEAPLADHHDVAYRDRDPGIVNDGNGSVSSTQRAGRRVIPTEEAGTLVEDFRDMREQRASGDAPEQVARQPNESDEAYAKRLKGK